MGELIDMIAEWLAENWKSLNSFTRFTITSLAGSAIVSAIHQGFNAIVHYLDQIGPAAIHALANFLHL